MSAAMDNEYGDWHGQPRTEGSMDWWKKAAVPAMYKTFAASYRYGFSDAAQGKRKQSQAWFSNIYAWRAYVAGYEAGELKAKETRLKRRSQS